jgi:hypothetical protein
MELVNGGEREMTNWKREIDLSFIIENDLSDAVKAQRIIEVAAADEGVPMDVVDSMRAAFGDDFELDTDEFNAALDRLYDWADDNSVWVKTYF